MKHAGDLHSPPTGLEPAIDVVRDEIERLVDEGPRADVEARLSEARLADAPRPIGGALAPAALYRLGVWTAGWEDALQRGERLKVDYYAVTLISALERLFGGRAEMAIARIDRLRAG